MTTKLTDIFMSSIANMKTSKKTAATTTSPKNKVGTIFAILEIYLRVCGLYCEGITLHDRKPRNTITKIVAIASSLNSYVFFVCVWINHLRLVPILIKEGQYSPAMMVTLLLFFAYLTSAWGFTCWMIMLSKHYQRIVQALESVTTVHWYPFTLNHFVLSVNISLTVSLVFPLYSLVTLFNDSTSLMTKISLTPAESGTTFWEFMKCFYTYYAVHAYVQFVLFSTFQAVVCYLLQREFKDVAEKVGVIAKKQDEFWEEGELEKLRLRHKDICGATMEADKVVSYIVFDVYVTGILIACFCVSCLTHGSYPANELPTLFAVAVASIGQVIFTSVLGAVLNHQAHRPHEILTRIKTPGLNRNDYRSMLVFLTQVSGSDIGITVIGMFTVNKPAILTILGTIITYAVIIQQLHVSQGTGSGHPANTTAKSLV